MNTDQLRKQALELTLVRFVEGLETLFVGVTVDTLKALDFEAALIGFVQEWERAPNDADTGEYPLLGLGWEKDETTEPIGVHNRGNRE